MNTFFLTMYFAFNLGLSQGGIQTWEPNDNIYQKRIEYTHTDLNTEFRLHYKDVAYLYVGGGIDCASKQEGSLFDIGEYSPHSVDFPFVAGIRIKDHVEIGYKYSCLHPMTTYLYDDDLKYKQEGSYSSLFVRFTGEVTLWK